MNFLDEFAKKYKALPFGPRETEAERLIKLLERKIEEISSTIGKEYGVGGVDVRIRETAAKTPSYYEFGRGLMSFPYSTVYQLWNPKAFLHELAHHIEWKTGKKFTEEEAERFAEEEYRKWEDYWSREITPLAKEVTQRVG